MAKVFPDGWRELTATGAAERELHTLAQFAGGLADDYTVYHGVHWTQIERGNYAIFGEIDFAIVGPTGKVLLIEQKAGFLSETPGGLAKKYAGKEKNVSFQMARSADALHRRLRKICGDQATFVDSLLYCPDYMVKDPGTAGIDPARIVDAAKKDHLMHVIRTILPESGKVLPAKEKIHRFLGEMLQLVPQADAVVGAAQTLYTRLSGGLAQWARRIECEPFRLRVTGTAGSGKTQLALAVYRDCVAAVRSTSVTTDRSLTTSRRSCRRAARRRPTTSSPIAIRAAPSRRCFSSAQQGTCNPLNSCYDVSTRRD